MWAHGAQVFIRAFSLPRLDSVDDMLVSGAAAEITFYRMTDFRFGRIAVAVWEIRRRHHHAGRAVAALKPCSSQNPCCSG